MIETPKTLYFRISEEMAENNFARVRAPVSRLELEAAADSFINDFLTLPQEVKEGFYRHIDNGGRGTDLGYVRRSRARGDNEDDKQFFHYNPILEEVLSDQMWLHIGRVGDFLDHASKIFQASTEVVDEVFKCFEIRHRGIHRKFFAPEVIPNFILRFLAYDRVGDGEFLATGHYDRGAYSLALGESAPRLRIGTNKLDVVNVEYQEGSALFFKARQEVLGINDGFSPAWHDVVQLPGQNYSDQITRWAIVCFIEPLKIRMVTREESHTPLKS